MLCAQDFLDWVLNIVYSSLMASAVCWNLAFACFWSYKMFLLMKKNNLFVHLLWVLSLFRVHENFANLGVRKRSLMKRQWSWTELLMSWLLQVARLQYKNCRMKSMIARLFSNVECVLIGQKRCVHVFLFAPEVGSLIWLNTMPQAYIF